MVSQANARFIFDEDYQRRVARALDAAWQRSDRGLTRPFQLQTDRCIIFSDQHKGARNRADDFLRAERAYNAALAYYYQLGHTLIELGDVEEMWEEYPGAVTQAYPHTFQLEARFHEEGRYLRVWGNHDEDWSLPPIAQLYLEPIFGAPLPLYESLKLNVMEGETFLGTLFLLHGHQGDPASDALSRWARLVVRWLWRPFQRLTGISANTPSKSWQLRERHNIALYLWAQKRSRLALIAGHTHRPVFRSQSHAEQLTHLLEELLAKLKLAPDDRRLRQIVGDVAAQLEWVRAQDLATPGDEGEAMPMTKPCYFNAGCCCYLDGDITGLELAEGEIRLVRWPDDQRRPRPQILVSALLKDVLAAC